MGREFTIDDLIKVAKRENNTKRSYLYVNPIQGKHIPVSPSLSLELFSQMTTIVEEKFDGESLLVIGFAETATAIGSAIAYKAKNVAFYMNTTRESIPDAEYLFFTESHSHATEQRLVKSGLTGILPKIDRIVFAEDEVTTGNTIEKLIDAILNDFDCSHCKFGIISILNSMPEERIRALREKQVECAYIHRIPARHRIDEIKNYSYKPLRTDISCTDNRRYRELTENNYWNSRVICDTETIRTLVHKFVEKVESQLEFQSNQRILILGTEEFMFPAMRLGSYIEAKYPDAFVRFHATTRSPIEISDDEEYPLHNRAPLNSLYEKGRKTFVYNLCHYDHVIIVTDANPVQSQGVSSLIDALIEVGNKEITMVRWEER